MTCLFCKIANGEIPANIIYQDAEVLAFRDITPQAPHHILCIPRKHIATVDEAREEDQVLLGKLILTAGNIARELSVAQDGYRLVMNCNGNGGQTVFHIHLHMFAGRVMHWPPG